MSESTTGKTAPKRENVWVNLICNALLPGFLLTQLSKEKALGQLLDTERVPRALEERNNAGAFNNLLVWASWVLAASFAISGILNFGLARWILKAPPGTPEFVAQLGKMHWLSWPVIVVPMMGMMLFALFRVLKGVEQLSGLKAEEIFHQPPPKTRSA